MIKTYGVFGKVEYVMMASVANKTVTIDFSGGSINNRGVIPASFKTNNPLVQRALEASDEFKVGIVKLIQNIPEECDMRAAKAREEAQVRAAREAEEKAKADAAAKQAAAKQKEVKQEAVPTAGDSKENAAVDEQEAGAEEANKVEEKIKVEVSCKEDAVEYLKANHGYTSSKLRSNEAIERAASEHGIEFVGLE